MNNRLIAGNEYKVKGLNIRGKLIAYSSATGEASLEMSGSEEVIITNTTRLIPVGELANTVCERCFKEIVGKIRSVSYFNTDVCCSECLEKEKQHELYELAKHIEVQEVKNGNTNFEGIGLPFELIEGNWLEMTPSEQKYYLELNEKFKKNGSI